ncbi:MAG: chromosome condensation regulator RCC1 [Bdellovibrionales bacterium]|nr:chromosome condensation regulator RCC1 [Bdellovibrionales bacterium]
MDRVFGLVFESQDRNKIATSLLVIASLFMVGCVDLEALLGASGKKISATKPGDVGATPTPTPTPSLALSKVFATSHISCARAGGVKCWGENTSYQLNNGAQTNNGTPADLAGYTDGVSQIVAGYEHVCALKNGGVKCWGHNDYGQIGDGSATAWISTPTDVSGLTTGVTAIAAGWRHNCALLNTGAVKCWGWNSYGQLGNGVTGGSSNVPVSVSGLAAGVTALGFARGDHSCALLASGRAMCWGYNFFRQLANGTTTDTNTPSYVYASAGVPFEGILNIASNRYGGCLVVGTSVMCWGLNDVGQIGDGTTTNSAYPVTAVGLSGIVSVGAGSDHNCALQTGGGVYCWGSNAFGQLGRGAVGGSSGVASTPSLITSGAVEMAVGRYHNCVRTNTDVMKCWGLNNQYQLGDGTTTSTGTPIDVNF